MAIINFATDNSGQTLLELNNPANREKLDSLVCDSAADVEAKVAKARAAQPAWAALSVDQRVDYLHKLRDQILDRRDEVVQTVVRETGKPLQDALVFEVYAVCDFITYYAKQAKEKLKPQKRKVPGILQFTKKLEINYKPLGVVGVISPWNGPFVLTANPCIQALLAGNTVLAKGSEVTPESAKILERLCKRRASPTVFCRS